LKPAHIRIQELQKEVENLVELREEAKSEWNSNMDEALYYRKKADEAEKRMHARQDEIERRLAEIAELEEQEVLVHAATA
jgi:chromosome segregation ATPase